MKQDQYRVLFWRERNWFSNYLCGINSHVMYYRYLTFEVHNIYKRENNILIFQLLYIFVYISSSSYSSSISPPRSSSSCLYLQKREEYFLNWIVLQLLNMKTVHNVLTYMFFLNMKVDRVWKIYLHCIKKKKFNT